MPYPPPCGLAEVVGHALGVKILHGWIVPQRYDSSPRVFGCVISQFDLGLARDTERRSNIPSRTIGGESPAYFVKQFVHDFLR